MQDNAVISAAARRRAWIPLSVIAALLALALLLLAPPAGAQTTDYDADDNRLIEIRNLAQFHAIRHDLNGNGDAVHAEYAAAFPGRDTNANTLMGCPAGEACQGYELLADLDFDSDGDGDVDANDHNGDYWNSGSGWAPIGNSTNFYTGLFHGRGHTISNLFISRSSLTYVGLFAVISSSSFRNLGLARVNVTGGNFTGGLTATFVGSGSAAANLYVTGQVSGGTMVGLLAGTVSGTLTASYSSGRVTAATQYGGGLVGRVGDNGSVITSYSTAAVSADTGPGGLAGIMWAASSAITDSYAIGRSTDVTPTPMSSARGLVAQNANNGTITNSYYDSQRTGHSDTGMGDPKTTRELRRPTGYTGIYQDWNRDLSSPADGVGDDPWDFGTHRNYPLLKVDFDGDGTATCEEFGNQPCYREPGPPPYNPAHDHPEIYANPRHEMATSCEVRTTGTGDDAVSTSTLTFDLGTYTRPLTLALSLWDGTHFRSLQSQNISMPELQQTGQTATVEVATDPAQTRFRIDSQYGLNLVLGYADCHTDDP